MVLQAVTVTDAVSVVDAQSKKLTKSGISDAVILADPQQKLLNKNITDATSLSDTINGLRNDMILSDPIAVSETTTTITQLTKRTLGRHGTGYAQIEGIGYGSTLIPALLIFAENLTKNVITLINTHATANLQYAIYATSKQNPNFATITSPEWINLVSWEQMPSTPYNHNLLTTVAPDPNGVTNRDAQSFQTPWIWIVVMVKSNANGTGNFYHSGVNF